MFGSEPKLDISEHGGVLAITHQRNQPILAAITLLVASIFTAAGIVTDKIPFAIVTPIAVFIEILLLRSLVGRDELRIEGNTLTIKKCLFGMHLTESLRADRIRCLRYENSSDSESGPPTIYFESQYMPDSFAPGISPQHAAEAIAAISRFAPQATLSS